VICQVFPQDSYWAWPVLLAESRLYALKSVLVADYPVYFKEIIFIFFSSLYLQLKQVQLVLHFLLLIFEMHRLLSRVENFLGPLDEPSECVVTFFILFQGK